MISVGLIIYICYNRHLHVYYSEVYYCVIPNSEYVGYKPIIRCLFLLLCASLYFPNIYFQRQSFNIPTYIFTPLIVIQWRNFKLFSVTAIITEYRTIITKQINFYNFLVKKDFIFQNASCNMLFYTDRCNVISVRCM